MTGGRLILSLHDNGTVSTVFMLNVGAGNSAPILAKDSGQAESDLVTRFGSNPSKARLHIEELKKKGQVNLNVNLDDGLAASLFRRR